VAFDGSASISTADPPRPITSYSWSFGDGALGNGAQTSHAYSSTGVYDVSLTIGDGTGRQSDPARTAAYVFSSLAAAFHIGQPRILTGIQITVASGFQSPACSNWIPATRVDFQERIDGSWSIPQTRGPIPGTTEWSFTRSANATAWKATVYYYAYIDGQLIGPEVRTASTE
jgi:hypothetical protein